MQQRFFQGEESIKKEKKKKKGVKKLKKKSKETGILLLAHPQICKGQ